MDAALLYKLSFYVGIGLGLSGSAWGLSIAFSAALGAGKQRFFSVMPLAVLPSTQGIYSLLAGILKKDALALDPSVGAVVLMVGIACLLSAIWQGKVCAAGIRSIADDRNVLANGIVSAAMPETYAVLAFVGVFLF
ncbi:MAG: hypothetical protein JXA24_01135 [Proteobacteria bacterium]|nr:hypothetical protein [Pseudomonadota bacterium]